MKDLVPLFKVTDEEGKEIKIVPVVTDGRRAYKAAKMVSDVCKAIKKDAAAVLQGKDSATLTIAAYIAMEELLQQGQKSMVDVLRSSSTTLEQAAYFTSIGLLAGRKLPKEVYFEAAEAGSDSSLREHSEDGSDPEESSSSGECGQSGVGG